MNAFLKPYLLASLLAALTSCYDYAPPPSSNPAQPGADKSLAANRGNSTSRADDEASQKIESGTQACMNQFPDRSGHKAEQVRCIIAATDVILDQTHPESAQQRHSLGAYAIQLAEREDRGELTREQAENLYMQFLQQSSALGLPPQKEP